MEITKIEENKKRPGYFNIYADSDFLCTASKDSIHEYHLCVGMNISTEEARVLVRKLQYKKAMENALNILSKSNKTEYELRKKLVEKEIDEEIIDEIIQRLIELDYINDEKYIEQWIKTNSEKPGANKRVLYNKLRQKGIDRELIETAISAEPVDEYASARKLADKKIKTIKGTDKEKKAKLYVYLMSKGFNSDICYKVVNEFIIDDF